MSGHESASLLRAYIKVCYPSSTGTLTCVKSLETFVRTLLPPYPNDSQERIISSFGEDD
jgi:hypothetical protein